MFLLQELAGVHQVQFRIGSFSGWDPTEGVAVDDIRIFDNPVGIVPKCAVHGENKQFSNSILDTIK